MKVFAVLAVIAVAFSAPGNAVNLAEKATELGATTLVQYLRDANLYDAVANIAAGTVFGPTNAAFDALPQSIKDALAANMTMLSQVLQYHVIPARVMSSQLTNEQTADTLDGRKVRINIYGTGANQVITAGGVQVTVPDQEADNGVIHVLGNGVMLPPNGNLVDYVVNNADFSTLLTAVTTANLQGVLGGAGPFTLFAPTNAAFAKIPEADLNALLADIPKLTKVLQYHVVSGTFYSQALSDGMNVPTLANENLRVSISSGTVRINDATVSSANINIDNGAIHVIDTVLMPADDPVTTPSTGAASTLQLSIISTLLASLIALLF